MGLFKLRQRRWVLCIGAYLFLLLISTAVRLAQAESTLSPEKRSIEVLAVADDKLLEARRVRLAYREFLPPFETGKTPIILIHGSPGDGGVLVDLANELSRERRVIVPDLPGFGDSTNEIPDYSFRAHAYYLKQLSEKIEVEKFHALGFSMGGGVVLELYSIAPERVASIEMISAIGVQEYELLGDYFLNHVVHGVQLAALWSMREFVPHFGFLDGLFFGVSYARNFYDSDQRPLRQILTQVELPFLIVHGEKDPLVPVTAAREHHRLVPQSEYQELDDNHFMVFMRPEKIAPSVADFLTRVDEGTAKTRASADPLRVAAAAEPFQREMIMADGLLAVLFFFVLAIATFISEDLTSLTAGALAGQGQISVTLAIAACFVGIYIGDLLIFLAGRFFGRAALGRAPLRWFISEMALDRAAAWLGRNGMTAVFLSRFTPGLRLPVYFAAGMLKTNLLKFALFFAIAAALWTPILVGATAWLSTGMAGAPMLTGNFWFGLVAVVGGAFILLNLVLRLATWRGRRILAGTYRRWTEWEFWPLSVFYLPVVIYILRLTVEFRSISVFADANPAIEAGGFVGEPKAEIYEGLRKSPAAKSHLLKYGFISVNPDPTERIAAADEFMRTSKLSFPIVLKPNSGERGSGVYIIKNTEQLESKIGNSDCDLILQEFSGGDEFGVFYFRYPSDEHGRIFAITEKRFPIVTGDGKANLETLILRDKRAVALANAYLERNADRLGEVPAIGETVSIIDIGTHSKGAIFLDGGWVNSKALEKRVDEICRGFTGFYFGRFDLRVNSIEEFKRGENFKIIELNGVTSEATNIYDPKYSLLDAYRILFRQWRIAFEIGHANRRRGTPPTSATSLLRLLIRNRFCKNKKSVAATASGGKATLSPTE